MFENSLNFVSLMARDRSRWPRCLLWHGWLPGLGLAGERDPRAASFGHLASLALERCLGAYPADGSGLRPNSSDADDTALEMTESPNIWTEGSREDYPVGRGG